MGRAAMIVAAFGGSLPHGVTGTNERCTLIVSNLNTDVSLELFKAFGCILSKFLLLFLIEEKIACADG
jgi:hypothetical protein